ncbi:aminoacyl-tRNA hydrolase [Rubrivirga sp.]|uniref:aminoacyl-tRNA hydrolase n=1 Tax=Rubrivirga sp. TaxID=1885344 RepID=UPI003B51A864
MSWLSRLLGGSPPPPSPDVSFLVVGLGNPGPDYDGTRHNAGFEVIDRLADRLGVALDTEAAHAFVAEGRLPPEGGEPGPSVALARPLTFMNRSGRAVAALLDRYGLGPADLLVVYDDLALPIGGLRLRGEGSSGGHNGVQSVIEALGSTEFPRLRVGVGNSFPPGGQVDFVLSPFDDDEIGAAEAAFDDAAQAALTVAREGLTAAMNRHNRRS